MQTYSRILRGSVAVILLTMAAASHANTTVDIMVESVRERLSWLTEAVAPLYENPAVKASQYNLPLTSLGVDVESSRDKTASVTAETYQHFGSSTVWGNASYSLGKVDDRGLMGSSVTPDATATPYLPATDRGGKFSSERYTFWGGYALTKGRWSYGATLSYDARLSYRSVDPRPKNISGTLSVTAGSAMTLSSRRYIAAQAGYERYTQSSSVMFVSQQGADPIYHLTGLGSRYRRFDGQGWKTVYGGNRFLLGVSTYPRHEGWLASVEMQTGKLSTVLADLNSLPLGNLTQYGITARAGYISPHWYAGVHGNGFSSTGTENIFGDPMASVYPVIASQKAYSDRDITLGMNGVRQLGAFTLRGDVSYYTQSKKYYADNRSLSLHTLLVDAGLQWQHLIGKSLMTMEGGVRYHAPLSGTLTLPAVDEQTDPVGARLAREVSDEYRYADTSHLSARVTACVTVPLKRVGLTVGAAADFTRYNTFNLQFSICL